jgi:hypothetical protein
MFERVVPRGDSVNHARRRYDESAEVSFSPLLQIALYCWIDEEHQPSGMVPPAFSLMPEVISTPPLLPARHACTSKGGGAATALDRLRSGAASVTRGGAAATFVGLADVGLRSLALNVRAMAAEAVASMSVETTTIESLFNMVVHPLTREAGLPGLTSQLSERRCSRHKACTSMQEMHCSHDEMSMMNNNPDRQAARSSSGCQAGRSCAAFTARGPNARDAYPSAAYC